MDKALKLILSELNDVVATPDKTTQIVIFPVGEHTIHVSNGADEPITLTVDVNEGSFNNIKSNLSNISEMFSDFNHDMKNASSWLKNIFWDAAKGIIAEVALTKDGLDAILGKSYKYFSPSFYVDDNNNIMKLENDFGAFTNSPGFDTLKNYPIHATKNKNMNIETPEPVVIPEPVIVKAEETKPEEKVETPTHEKTETAKEEKEEHAEYSAEHYKGMCKTVKFLEEAYAELKTLVEGKCKAEEPKKEKELGKEVEKEHGLDEKKTEEIVEDHLKENPEYYSKLDEAGLAEKKEVKAERKVDRSVLTNITTTPITAEKPKNINDQNALVKKVQAEHGLSYLKAWTLAKSIKPELF